MSNPNFPNQTQNDARYATPAGVTAAIAAQATTDTGLYSAKATAVTRDAKVHYGAVGDGTTDDTAALQSAFNDAASYGYEVYIPAGTYKVSSSLTSSTAIRVRGAGVPFTKIAATAGTFDIVHIGGTTRIGQAPSGWLRDIKVAGPSGVHAANGYAAVKIDNLTLFRVEGVHAEAMDIGFDLVNNCYGTQFDTCRAMVVNVGMNLRVATQSGSQIPFRNCWFSGYMAAVHIAPTGTGYVFWGGQLNTYPTVANDAAGAIVYGKDYISGSTGGVGTVSFENVDFEAVANSWFFRGYGKISFALNNSPVLANQSDAALGVLKAEGADQSKWIFENNQISGTFNTLLSLAGVGSTAEMIESGWTMQNLSITVNAASVYFSSLQRNSATYLGTSQFRDSNKSNIMLDSVRIRDGGSASGLQTSYDNGTTWANVTPTTAGDNGAVLLSPTLATQWYAPMLVTGVRTLAQAVGRLYLAPCYTRTSIVVSQFRTNVTTAAAGSVIRTGIYTTPNGGMAAPWTLLVDGGTIDTSATGFQSVTLGSAVTIPADTYFWIASAQQGTAASTVTVGGVSGGGYGFSPLAGGYNVQRFIAIVSSATTYTGVLPTTLTASFGYGTNVDGGVEYYRSA